MFSLLWRLGSAHPGYLEGTYSSCKLILRSNISTCPPTVTPARESEEMVVEVLWTGELAWELPRNRSWRWSNICVVSDYPDGSYGGELVDCTGWRSLRSRRKELNIPA